MDAARFHEMFAILHNLNRWDLEDAGIMAQGASGGSDWIRFNRDLTTFVLKRPEDRLQKLFALIESRQPKPAVSPVIIPLHVFDEDRTSEVA